MPEVEITSLAIQGYRDSPVPNKLFRHSMPTDILAILFPGLHYTCDMPLLYYLKLLMSSRHVDVLQLHTNYTGVEFQSLPGSERFDWMSTDARAALAAVYAHAGYTKLVLVGKSIGTLALAYLVTSEPGNSAITIWLTPLLHNPLLVEGALQLRNPALFIGSRSDSSFDETTMTYIQDKTHCDTHIMDGANHSLEFAADPFRSLWALQGVLERVNEFLSQQNIPEI